MKKNFIKLNINLTSSFNFAKTAVSYTIFRLLCIYDAFVRVFMQMNIYTKSHCNLIIVIRRVYSAITQSNYVRR